jgi:hypothetical protein
MKIKRFIAALLAICALLLLNACTEKYERPDNYAKGFISAICMRDEQKMLEYIHPDYKEVALPNDSFYEALAKQYFTVGNEMTALSAVGKTEKDGYDGDALVCSYVTKINELIYSVELIMLENDNGYGIISVAMVLNTDIDYYYNENQGAK